MKQNDKINMQMYIFIMILSYIDLLVYMFKILFT